MSIITKMFEELRLNPESLVAYQSDFLIHDVKVMGEAKLGDQFVWIVRDHGTHLIPLGADPDYANAVMDSEGVKFIRLIQVSQVRENETPDGHLDRIYKVEARALLADKFKSPQAV